VSVRARTGYSRANRQNPGDSSREGSIEKIVMRRRWYEHTAAVWALRLAPAILFLAVWQVYALLTTSTLIPTALDTLTATVRILGRPEVIEGFLTSGRTMLLGFLVSVVLGVPIGFIMGRVRALEKVLDPWLDILIIVPMAAIIPLVIMSVGLGLDAQVLVVVLFTISMVAVNCRAGVREVPEALIDMARVYGANERKVWTKILLPGSSPALFAGLRIGLGRAVLGMVLVELIMTAVGIGLLLQQYRTSYRMDELYAVIFLVVLASVALIGLMGYIEKKLVPWASVDRRASD